MLQQFDERCSTLPAFHTSSAEDKYDPGGIALRKDRSKQKTWLLIYLTISF